jgi:hypothetical protein
MQYLRPSGNSLWMSQSDSIGNDLKMLGYYGLVAIPGARDLQRVIPNTTKN